MKWPWHHAQALPPSAALVGKLPSQPDFVREGCRGASAAALDAWLVEAVPPLSAAGSLDALGSVAFCFSVPKRARVLLGVLEPSRDSRGRVFPVAVFREANLDDWRPRLGELWQRAAAFRAAAQALINELKANPQPDLATRLSELPTLDVGNASDASDPMVRSPAESARDFLRGTVGADPPASLFYALSTLSQAFADPKPRAGLALDCPIRDEHDTASWLQLAAQLSEPAGLMPSAFCATDRARLLIAVAAPAPELLQALAEPQYQRDQFWPLKTEQPGALEHAHATLAPVLPELLSGQRELAMRALGERLVRAEHAKR